MADTFQIEIVTPERLLVSDQATEAQVPGTSGYLGILPGHAPLITELRSGELNYRRPDGSIERLALHWGFAEVLPDNLPMLKVFENSGFPRRQLLAPSRKNSCRGAGLGELTKVRST